ncbi:hypothetical protein GALMADRAFT_122759 [Galerina marginata CBS 339.88]|uniref:Alpha-ketoglutarate-dependent dioxygenase AlkB-like domain-containing protein n=1 Tax=Galerina marginata (strain CBS 339.88) TaxID=685588 RepID=A0A067SW26_GALM3|nr:hypothetical protein GALMADRAFT_122759 [Galerina marginata CBS 339.88]
MSMPRPMRTPRSWDDRDILQDELLCSIFPEHGRLKTIKVDQTIKLLARPENRKSVEAWLKYAFSSTSRRKIDFKYSTARAFVHFFWYLYKDDTVQALKILNRERLTEGLPKVSADALSGTGLADSVHVFSKQEGHFPQNAYHPTAPSNCSKKERKHSLMKPVIPSESSFIQNLPTSSLTTSETINPSTSHVGKKGRYTGLRFTRHNKVEASAENSVPNLVSESEMSSIPPLLLVLGECNPIPMATTQPTVETSEKTATDDCSDCTFVPNVPETHSPLSPSPPTNELRPNYGSNIPMKRPATPLVANEPKRCAVDGIGMLKDPTEMAPKVIKCKGKSQSKRGRPSSIASVPLRNLRSNKAPKAGDSYPLCVSNPESSSGMSPSTNTSDHHQMSSAPTALATAEITALPEKNLENHEDKRRATAGIDIPKKTCPGTVFGTTKKSKGLSQPKTSRHSLNSTVSTRSSCFSNSVKIEDSTTTSLPNSQLNPGLSPFVPVANQYGDNPVSAVAAAPETSKTSHVRKKGAYEGLRFNRTKGNGQTSNSEIGSEMPPSILVANECNHSTSVASMAFEAASNVPEKRPSFALDHEAKQHAATAIVTPVEKHVQQSTVGASRTKDVEVKGISRSKRARFSTATPPQRSLRSSTIIKAEGGSIFAPNSEMMSDSQLPRESDSSLDLTTPTIIENAGVISKKRSANSLNSRKAKRRIITGNGIDAETHVQEMVAAENSVEITQYGRASRTVENCVLVSKPEVAMGVQEMIHIKAETLDSYDIRPIVRDFPPMLHGQACGHKDESMFLLDDIFKEEFKPDWIRPLFPNGLPEDVYQFPKPPLRFLPPIWAESRQELCESFDWFRSYQGGVYHAHNVAKGYLLSAFPSSRDIFEHGGKLIISHGGGRAESLHSTKGQITSQPATDQMAQDKSVRALFDNYLNNRPLALVMDDKYALFPFDLRAKGIAYAVLGFYTIAHAWAEYQPANNESGRVVRYKFAFRWCEQQGPPWWWNRESGADGEGIKPQAPRTNIESSPSAQENFLSKDFYDLNVIMERKGLALLCKRCHKYSLRIFDLSWACLNPDCHSFWRIPDGNYLPIHLEYHHNFLQLPPSRSIPAGFGDLAPASPLSFLPGDSITNYAFTRGFHCQSCGRLSCRDKWEKWECMNSDCQHSLVIQCPPRNAKEFLYQTESAGFKDHSLNAISEIVQLSPSSFIHEYGRAVLHTFLLPHDGAKIHHIQSGNALGRKEADDIFRDYQTQAASGSLRFRRWPMRAHKCRGALLTNYFSQNSGEPYKYVGGDANTVPFETAPDAVVNARALIQKRINQALGVSAEFNEVLSAAYMERQKMAFHSDNEVGLGPLVAGLSLGSPALMHFRLHAKHDPEREKRGILLSVILRHGDVLVMDGAGVQEYYEHTVVPDNFRIAATARQINSRHI